MTGWKLLASPLSIALATTLFSSIVLGDFNVQLSRKVNLVPETYKAESRLVQKFMGIKYASRPGGILSPLIVDTVYPEGNNDFDAVIRSSQTPRYICPQCDNERVPETIVGRIPLAFGHGEAKEDFEECLQLSVYRPSSIRNKDKKRVVVLVHGGGLKGGSSYQGHYNPEYFFRDNNPIGADTIMVSINYSLGPFGFWASKGEENGVQGNAALFELFSALRWVHQHISKFGGDPFDITLMGHSAGAALVNWAHFALHSEELVREAGLWFEDGRVPFRKLLIMGGSAFLFDSVSLEQALEQQNLLLEKLEVSEKNLIKKSGSAIANAAKTVNSFWTFVVDGKWIKGNAAFHLQNNLFGQWKSFDLRLTYNSEDSSIFCYEKRKEISEEGLNYWTSFLPNYKFKQVETFYDCERFGGCKLRSSVCMSTDAIFVGPALAIRDSYQKRGLNVDIHEFSFDPQMDRIDKGVALLNEFKGAFDFLKPLLNVVAKDVVQNVDGFHALGTHHISEIWVLLGAPLKKVEREIKRGHQLVEETILPSLLGSTLGFIENGCKSRDDLRNPRNIHEEMKFFPVGEAIQSLYLCLDKEQQHQLREKNINRQLQFMIQENEGENSSDNSLSRKRVYNNGSNSNHHSNKVKYIKLEDPEDLENDKELQLAIKESLEEAKLQKSQNQEEKSKDNQTVPLPKEINNQGFDGNQVVPLSEQRNNEMDEEAQHQWKIFTNHWNKKFDNK